MIMGHFGPTYLRPTHVPCFNTMPITLVQFLLRYLPTLKLDVLYQRSLISNSSQAMNSLDQMMRMGMEQYFIDVLSGDESRC